MKRDLVFEETYPYPADRVWRALTDPGALADWLMENDFQAVLGHRFQFRAKPQPGWDGVVHCEVTVVDPPHRLAYKWRSTDGALDTEVRFTLDPVASGTRLKLEHLGFSGFKAVAISYMLGSGWKGMVQTGIPKVIENVGDGVYVRMRPVRACAEVPAGS